MTAILSSPGPAPAPVRIRRAPALEPPVDDDRRADDHPVCTGQLALFSAASGPRGTAPTGTPDPTGDPDRTRTTAGTATAAAQRPSSPPAGSAQIAASRFVAACVEVLNGFRPVGHLRALTAPLEFTAVTTQLTRRAVRLRLPGRAPGGPARLGNTTGPGSPARAGNTTGPARVGIRRLRVCQQHAGVAEAVAVLGHGETSWAMALRFEYHRHGSWLCTLLEVV
ncbi:Rv3235 family protein [Planosporangium sp. 12N6]|uniref:Rv3235 family protein n=1 Tax=Planosporangium spinosum TaxID=3402278 RepID=UPI003CF7D8B5